jgi:hypothetical protein
MKERRQRRNVAQLVCFLTPFWLLSNADLMA